MRHQLAIVAAIAEQVVRLGLLEVAAADFGGRNMRSDRQHRNPRALAIVKPVDEMQIARAARARAHRELSGQRRLGSGRERRGLLVADVHPFDVAAPAQ